MVLVGECSLHLLLFHLELLLLLSDCLGHLLLLLLHSCQLLLSLSSLLSESFILFLKLLLLHFILISTLWLKLRLEQDLSSWLVVKHDGEPVFNSAVNNQGTHLDLGETNCVTGGHILVPASKNHFVCCALHFQLELIVPDGLLATLVVDLGLELLVLESDGDVWRHLSHEFSIVSQLALRHL